MNVYRMRLYAVCMSSMFSALTAMDAAQVVQPSECALYRVLNVMNTVLHNGCSKVLTISSRPALAAVSCIRECGLLADKYLLKNAEKHPCITGAVTIAAFILFLHATQTGRNWCVRIENFFEEGNDESDEDQCCKEGSEESAILIDQDAFTTEKYRTHYRFE